MATVSATYGGTRLGVVRSAAATGTALAILFALCWAFAAASDLRLTHMFLELFSSQPPRSAAALGEGILWSLVAGAVTGGLVSWLYNLFAFLDRR